MQEMELQKLVLVHLKLSSKALWFEPPTIVKWEAEKGYWSTEGFFDVKFDEGKQTLSFRTINFGIFALSAFRFSNLPLQSWELRYSFLLQCRRSSETQTYVVYDTYFHDRADQRMLTKQ